MTPAGRLAAVLLLSSPAASALGQDAEAAAPVPDAFVTLGAVGALSLVPLLFLLTTSFVKISVVFSLLRNALGAPEVPSGAVIAALAGVLTLYVMAPVGARIAEAAGPPAADLDPAAPFADLAALERVLSAAAEPLGAFLERNAGERERQLFLSLAREARAAEGDGDEGALPPLADDDLLVLLPAFLVTELAEAFQIGFLVLLPFLVVDLVVANTLMSLGMHMLSPNQVSLPFKLLLFVLVDGWYLLARALVLGYA